MNDQRAKAAAVLGSAFMREARAPIVQPANSMVATQQAANARPIPTYAAGGKIAACAAGGVGKLRKGQAKEPGRGRKMDQTF